MLSLKQLWGCWFGGLPPGVRGLLFLLVGAVLALMLAGLLQLDGPFANWLALDPAAVWHGRVWQILTYVLLPSGVLEFLFSLVIIACLGARLERAWSAAELWSYCVLVAGGAGLTKLALASLSRAPLAGAGTVVLGLVVAWLEQFGQERTLVWGVWDTTVRHAAWVMLGAGLAVLLVSMALADVFVLVSGGLTGWLYLSVRWWFNRRQASQPVVSKRIRRLEL